jgi:zinc protease
MNAATKLFSVAALTLGCWSAGQAQVETPPPPSAPRPFRIDAPRETTLPNGLRVVVAERRGLPVVTARLLVLSGNEVDPAGRSGAASMTAQLLPMGTRHHDATAIANLAEALGGTLASDAGWDRSAVSMTITTPKLDEALGLMAEVATEPVFKVEELDRLRTRSIDSLKVAYANPGTLASLVATRMLFGGGAYGNPSGGTPASLARIDRADLLDLYRARYRPDNAVLILVGDIDLAHAAPLAARRFGKWTRPKEPLPPRPVTGGSPSERTMTVVDMGATGQAGVVVAFPMPALDRTEWATSAVTNMVLGGGFSSRLNQEIRIKRGLSYGARAVVDERRDDIIVRATVQTKTESATEVVALVQAELDRLVDEAVPPVELEARKATLIGVFSRSVETTSGLGMTIADFIALGRSPSELPTLIDRLSAVNSGAVQQFARTRYVRAARRVAVAGDASHFEAELKTVVPDLVSVKQSQLDLEKP